MPALFAATALSVGSASATSASSAEERLVGLWLGLHDKIKFPSGCDSGEPMRYSSDGSFAGPGVSGTWRLRDDRLTETAREVYEEIGGDPAAIGKPDVSGIAWEGSDKFVKTFSDGSRMTFRRCPEAPALTAAPKKNVPAQAHYTDADARVHEQIAAACENKPGRMEPASVIERDLTGDDKADLIVHHHGIECKDGGRSIFCGAQMCSAKLYVRRGAQLHAAGEFGAVEWIRIEGGKIPTIHTIAHGGKPFALRWNGREFRVVSARLPPSPAARSKAADYLVREQIDEACDGKAGTIDESAAIERDLTGDGKADLVISHEGISCADGGRSTACGAQVCSVMIYVRRGKLLKLEREMLAAQVSVKDGAIRMHAHGGKQATIRWDGRRFHTDSAPRTVQESASMPALPAQGRIEGKLSYPSDYIPKDMVVCAEDIQAKHNHCNSKRKREGNGEFYTLIVPPGKYHVYAKTNDLPNVRAYYSEFVTCGLDAKCPSHKPIVVEVGPGATVTSVHPQDWYN